MKITNNTESLKRTRDFTRAYRRGKFAAGGFVGVHAIKNPFKNTKNRAGFVAGKSVGNAVTRNRVKRILREAYRFCAPQLPLGYDFVFVARSRASAKTAEQLTRDIRFALAKLGFKLQKPKK